MIFFKQSFFFVQMNLTVRYNIKDGNQRDEDVIFSNQNCSDFKHRFSKDDYIFGMNNYTTFYVYIYDMKTPMWVVISFSQHPKLDLLQFFITFST